MPDLDATLDVPLPDSLPAGSVTAVFCCGSCTEPELELLVDGARHAPTAAGMRGRFWGIVPVHARGGAVRIEAAAGGATALLGQIEVTAPEPSRPTGEGLIAVCMATFEPDMDLFRTQLSSLREQTDENWTCVISDDASSPERFEQIVAAVGEDERFSVTRADEQVGFYENFERALRQAPPEADLIALCDQDDRWHPDKLASLRAALGDAQLAYCDQRIVDPSGRVLRETMWQGRRNDHTDLASLIVANSVTGAGMLLRREVAELALPFPERHGFRYHDHWLALVALASGDIAYVARPLYDYVQHAGAHTLAEGEGPHGAAGRLRVLLARWRALYFFGYLTRAVAAETLLLRCDERLTAAKRRALERFVAADRSLPAFLRLALRPLRHRRETLGTEIELAQGIAWRFGARVARLDADLPPPEFFEQRRLARWRGSVR